MLDRREVMAVLSAGAAWPALARLPASAPETGWAALDLGTGRRWGENPHARLPMCSTFKWLLAAHVLWRAERGLESLAAPVGFGAADLLFNSPGARAAVEAGGGRGTLTVAQLAAVMMADSDNAAANLLLARSGGPAALTAWLRGQGDMVTRLDRTEPSLNNVPRGDARDTTTPFAMVGTLRRMLYGGALRPASRARLLAWLVSCRTGPNRLAAGLPAGWRIGHRTGTATFDPGDPADARNAAGDVGVLLPSRGRPILVAAYAAGWTGPLGETEAWMAGVARRVAATR